MRCHSCAAAAEWVAAMHSRKGGARRLVTATLRLGYRNPLPFINAHHSLSFPPPPRQVRLQPGAHRRRRAPATHDHPARLCAGGRCGTGGLPICQYEADLHVFCGWGLGWRTRRRRLAADLSILLTDLHVSCLGRHGSWVWLHGCVLANAFGVQPHF